MALDFVRKSVVAGAVAALVGLGLMAPLAAGTTGPTVCSGTLAPGTYQAVSVPQGQSCSIGSGVVVVASVVVTSGGALTDGGATVGANVRALGAASVSITGGTVHHTVSISGTSGAVAVTGTTIGDNVSVSNGAGAVVVTGDNVANNLSVVDNAPGGATVTSNAVTGLCSQSLNSPYVGFGNTGPHVAACNGSPVPAGLTTCTGPLPSGTYSAVVVPSAASCTLGSGVIVLKNVTVSSGGHLTDNGAAVVNNLVATGAASVAVTGGAVNHDIRLVGTSGSVSIGSVHIGDNLNVSSGAGAVDISGNTVAANVTVNNNSPGGASVTTNSVGGTCSQSMNNPYTGSGNTGPNVTSCNSASASTGVTICTGTLAAGTYQAVSVPQGQSCSLGTGVLVVTKVVAASGAHLADSDAVIGGDLRAVGAATVTVTGGTVHQTISITGTSGGVSVSGATVGANVAISNGAGTVVVSGNTVTNNVTVTGNAPGGATITANAVAGRCAQSSNSPYAGFGNTGPNVASCNGSVAPPALTNCTAPLPSGTYTALLVPSGQTCTLGTGVIVLKNVTVSSGGTLHDSGAAIVNDVLATGAASVVITGGTVNHTVRATGTSGTVSISSSSIGYNLVVTGGAGAVAISGNHVANGITVDDNAPGGATVTGNTDLACHQLGNHPYAGSGNSVAGTCNRSNT